MTAYNVTVEQRDSGRLLEEIGEFYTLGTAERQAIKASRRFTSPDVLAVMRYTSPTGTPKMKRWRMGKVYRQVP